MTDAWIRSLEIRAMFARLAGDPWAAIAVFAVAFLERRREYMRGFKRRNPHYFRDYHRERQANDPTYRARRAARAAAWNKANPDRINARRRAARKAAS